MSDLLQIDPIELEVGYALIPLVDEKQGGDLLERISMLRKQSAQELGILVPAIRIRDDIRLPANEYVIKLRGAEIARGEVMPRFLLALDTGRVIGTIDGIDTIDPSFGMPARWIAAGKRVEAESLGYVVVEPATVVATHLMEKLKSNAADLLGRQDVQEMVDTLKKTHPALVDDVIPASSRSACCIACFSVCSRSACRSATSSRFSRRWPTPPIRRRIRKLLTEHVRRVAHQHDRAAPHGRHGGIVRGITMGARLELALLGLFSPRAGQAGTTSSRRTPSRRCSAT